MTPAGVEVLADRGHKILVESNAGLNSGFANQMYLDAGASIADEAAYIFANADMVMHVKEPQPSEYKMIRKDQIVFTYLHLAADEQQTHGLIDSEAICIAYETIQKT